jgi:glycosyltransferase involved in cell wall biosynthesis
VIEAMGAGKPVVVLRFPPDSPYNAGAELVATRDLIAPGEADYIEIADRLLRDPARRQKYGEAMLSRFRAEFRPDRQASRYIDFINRLIVEPTPGCSNAPRRCSI